MNACARSLGRFVRNRPAVLGPGDPARRSSRARCSRRCFYPGSPFALVGKPFQPPFGEYLFGTDLLGRDLAAASLHGARTTLLIGLVATAIAVLVGVTDRRAGRLLRRPRRRVLMRLTEIFQTIPFFLFAILLRGGADALDRQRHHRHRRRLVAADGAPGARRVPRHARPRIRAGLRLDGHEPTRGSSCATSCPTRCRRSSSPRSLMVATAILIESSLSFLGLSDPNVMSWGFIIGAGRTAHPLGLVGVRDSGHRDPAHRDVDQPRRRRPQRRAQPAAAHAMSDGSDRPVDRRPDGRSAGLGRSAPCRRGRQPGAASRRDPVRRRRVGLGQVGDGALDPGPVRPRATCGRAPAASCYARRRPAAGAAGSACARCAAAASR